MRASSACPVLIRLSGALIDRHRGRHLAHGTLLRRRQSIFVEVINDLLGALDRRIVQRVVQDGQA